MLNIKNIKAIDKTKIDMIKFSVFGLQQIAGNWLFQGVASLIILKKSVTSNVN